MWSTLVHVSVLRIMDALIDISLFDCLHMEQNEGRKGREREREKKELYAGPVTCYAGSAGTS